MAPAASARNLLTSQRSGDLIIINIILFSVIAGGITVLKYMKMVQGRQTVMFCTDVKNFAFFKEISVPENAVTVELTKQNGVQMFQVILAKPVDPCLVAQQCVLIASKLTDIIDDKDIATLNMAKSVGGEAFMVEKLHCLWVKEVRE